MQRHIRPRNGEKECQFRPRSGDSQSDVVGTTKKWTALQEVFGHIAGRWLRVSVLKIDCASLGLFAVQIDVSMRTWLAFCRHRRPTKTSDANHVRIVNLTLPANNN